MTTNFEHATAQVSPGPFGRPYCVAEDRRDSGATVREFERRNAPTYFWHDSELARLRAENYRMRAALDVISRTLGTVERTRP